MKIFIFSYLGYNLIFEAQFWYCAKYYIYVRVICLDTLEKLILSYFVYIAQWISEPPQPPFIVFRKNLWPLLPYFVLSLWEYVHANLFHGLKIGLNYLFWKFMETWKWKRCSSLSNLYIMLKKFK